jgi:tRNA A-37 threonylcarbamoyl transferase component Bud32
VVEATIGRYRIEAQIGRGATGVVYKAIDPTLNREVAIKVLRPDAADADTLRRFRTEAAVLARLNHTDIATIYELVQSDTELFMVMELVAGESLEAVATRAGRLPVDAAAYVIDRVLAALTHAHEVGVVHRDLKPANVMVTRSGGVKLMDFGIARVYAGERITLHGSMMGTPGYMAPEQILGNPVDARADVYAVGAMLYRLLAGAVPFAGDSTVAVIQRQLSESVAPIRTLAADVPEAYDEIVARAMAKAPEERFQTADEFRQALGGVSGTLKTIDLARRLAEDMPAAPVIALDDVTAAAAPITPTAVLPGRRPSRWRWTATATIVAAAAVAGIVVGRRTQPVERPVAAAPVAPPGGSSPAAAQPRGEGTAPVPQARDGSAPSSPVGAEPQAHGAAPRPSASEPQPVGGASAALVPTAASDKQPDIDLPPPPVQVFDAKLLSIVEDKAREFEARLVLENTLMTVTPADEAGEPLRTLPYEKVKSISYSISRDPLWMSPHGPAPVIRRGGTLRLFGISVPRHWVALRTAANTFVVLRLNESTAPALVSSLEERTGHRSQRLAEVRRFKE